MFKNMFEKAQKKDKRSTIIYARKRSAKMLYTWQWLEKAISLLAYFFYFWMKLRPKPI